MVNFDLLNSLLGFQGYMREHRWLLTHMGVSFLGGLFGVRLVGTNLFTKVAPFVNQFCDLLKLDIVAKETNRFSVTGSADFPGYQ